MAPNLMQIFPNCTIKVDNLHHCRKFMQIRCQKGASTKMHKCLVGYEYLSIEINHNKHLVKLISFIFNGHKWTRGIGLDGVRGLLEIYFLIDLMYVYWLIHHLLGQTPAFWINTFFSRYSPYSSLLWPVITLFNVVGPTRIQI